MFPNQQRRLFRGRGGPNDRRLPKYNARRRRQLQQKQQQQSSGEEQLSASDEPNFNDTASGEESALTCGSMHESPMIILTSSQPEHNPPTESEAVEPSLEHESIGSPPVSATIEKCHQEIEHLLRRTYNNRQVMSLSTKALALPSAYKTHVLQAVTNCFVEWRSIRRCYAAEWMQLDAELVHRIGQALFELIQQALQCGPMAGSNPGYFKRCGADVAQIVFDCLDQIVPAGTDDIMPMPWTEKQTDAVKTWKNNAQRAIQAGKLASKSVSERQEFAKKQAAAKNDLRNKKMQKRKS